MNARVRLGAVAILGALTAAACSGSKLQEAVDPPIDTSTSSQQQTVTPPTEPVSYTWQRLPLGAGGFVTGLVIHATGAMYARTDVGGAYRYDASSRSWAQMLAASTVPGADAENDDYAVEAIAVSPVDANVVMLSVGGDPNPGENDPLPMNGRVLRSNDGGRTWQASTTTFFISGNQEHRQRSERLAIDPSNPQHVFLGTRRQGLWESVDGAATFRQVNTAAVPTGFAVRPTGDHAGVSFVTFDPVVAGRVYVGVAGVGVLRSDDNGRSWNIVVPAQQKQVPFEGSIVNGRLLVSISTIDGEVLGSIGAYDPTTGTVKNLTPPRGASAWSGAVDPKNPNHIVITTDAVRSNFLWRSIDGGATWDSLEVAINAASIPWLDKTDLAQFMSVGRLVFDPVVAGRLWFAEGMGVWRTDDFVDTATRRTKMTWLLDSRGIEELVIADIVAPPGGSPITVAADRQGFRTTSIADFPTAPLIDARFGGGTDVDYTGRNPKALVWIGAEYHLYFADNRRARAATSLDGGATWSELPNLTKDMFGGNVAVSATNPKNIVWLPSYFLSPFEHLDKGKGLYVTSNGGATWKNLTVDKKNNFHRLMWWLSRQALTADKVDGGVFYLQNDTAEFYVSTDGGQTWKKAAHAPPCTEAQTCHVYGQLLASPATAGALWSGVADAGLYRNDDRGASAWRKVPGVDEVRAFGFGASLVAGGPNAVYLYGRANGDERLGIWRSGDDGVTWQLLDRTPLDLYATITTVNGDLSVPGRVYVGYGGNGVVYGEPTPKRAS